jgi:coenzyme F420-0:L-glutamate ligase/coenzyme F420-1:gamma-L-glutamate ligase
MAEVRIIPLTGIPEVVPGSDLAALLAEAIAEGGAPIAGDILVVAHKVVSKAEGRIERGVPLETAVLREARRVRRRRGRLVIAETPQGFVCGNAGVDRSNSPDAESLGLLPRDPDASARSIHDRLRDRFGIAIPVVVSDSFGRAWRRGTTNVAIGVAGMLPLLDLRGTKDGSGRRLESTLIAVADELASAADLACGKAARIPAALVRGFTAPAGDGAALDLVIPPEDDLFP